MKRHVEVKEFYFSKGEVKDFGVLFYKHFGLKCEVKVIFSKGYIHGYDVTCELFSGKIFSSTLFGYWHYVPEWCHLHVLSDDQLPF